MVAPLGQLSPRTSTLSRVWHPRPAGRVRVRGAIGRWTRGVPAQRSICRATGIRGAEALSTDCCRSGDEVRPRAQMGSRPQPSWPSATLRWRRWCRQCEGAGWVGGCSPDVHSGQLHHLRRLVPGCHVRWRGEWLGLLGGDDSHGCRPLSCGAGSPEAASTPTSARRQPVIAVTSTRTPRRVPCREPTGQPPDQVLASYGRRATTRVGRRVTVTSVNPAADSRRGREFRSGSLGL